MSVAKPEKKTRKSVPLVCWDCGVTFGKIPADAAYRGKEGTVKGYIGTCDGCRDRFNKKRKA